MNADPRVMAFLPRTLSRTESNDLVESICMHFDEQGYGLWAVEAPGVAGFVGIVGLTVVQFEAHFTPAVEVGWRLALPYWGRGYATEAAQAAVGFGFEQTGLEEIVAFTVPHNQRSRRVMERLGMTHRPDDDFEHPRLAPGHPLRPHVLYRLSREAWTRVGPDGDLRP